MLVCDNQQETSWFAGILEGEGSCFNDGRHSGIKITNTDIDIINACVAFLHKKTIFYHIDEQIHRNRPTSKKVYNICINGVNNCYTLIKYLDNSFQCRNQEFLDRLKVGSSTTTRDATLLPNLNWLVGLCEAEGYLGLVESKGRYNPRISIKNTKSRIIEKLAVTLFDCGLSWYVYTENIKISNRLPVHQLSIAGMKRVQRFLIKTQGLWMSKKYANKAALLLEFLTDRFAMVQNQPYSQRQHEIYRQLKLKI